MKAQIMLSRDRSTRNVRTVSVTQANAYLIATRESDGVLVEGNGEIALDQEDLTSFVQCLADMCTTPITNQPAQRRRRWRP